MRLLVIANCQGAPLAKFLELWFAPAEIRVIAVHQTGQKSLEFAKSLIRDQHYDAVLTQPIADTYPVEFVRTSYIADVFKGKTFTWPNAYFRAYNPELQYLRRGGRHTLGPLGDYHVTTLVDAFQRGDDIERAASLLGDEDFNRAEYGSVGQQSLAELQERERTLDISISSFLERDFLHQRLFHSFNHPTNRVLFEIARRLAEKIGLKQKYPYQPGLVGEFLSHIRAPLNPYLKEQMVEARARRVYIGIAAREAVYTAGGRPNAKLYSDTELTQAFYALYDASPLKQ